MKKLLVIVMCCGLIVGVCACKKQAETPEPSDTTEVTTETPETTPENTTESSVAYNDLEKSLAETLMDKGISEEEAKKAEEVFADQPTLVAIGEDDTLESSTPNTVAYLVKDEEGTEYVVAFGGGKLTVVQPRNAAGPEDILYMEIHTDSAEE